jgi:hypothetical protein
MRAAVSVGRNKGSSYTRDEVDVRLADGSEIRARAALGGYMGPTEQRPYPDFEQVTETDADVVILVMPEDAPKTIDAAMEAMPGDLYAAAQTPVVLASWPGEESFTMVVKNRFGPTGPVRVMFGRWTEPAPLPDDVAKTPEELLAEGASVVHGLLRREDVSESDRVTDENAARMWLGEVE